MKTTTENLMRVRALLSDPKRWVQGATAKDKRGFPLNPENPGAACYCLVGAIAKVKGTTVEVAQYSKEYYLLEICLHGSVTDFNDSESTTHFMILNLLDKAIEFSKDAQ